MTVAGDKGQLKEVFVTLLDNAVKYGKDNTTVRITALKNDSSVVIKVADEGIGIPEQDLPHIFERFYRVDHSRNKVKAEGYGLGLSVAESIVKAHGGTIMAESVVDTGTTITIELPRK